jgi:hypothetical protein
MMTVIFGMVRNLFLHLFGHWRTGGEKQQRSTVETFFNGIMMLLSHF